MEKLVLASHGSLASGMKTAVKMIVGDVDRITCYDLDVYQEPSKIYNELLNEITNNPDDTYIIVTDLLGGSVHISLLPLCEFSNVAIVSGMNLGLVMEIFLVSSESYVEKIENALDSSISAMKVFTKEKISQYLDDDI